MKLRVVQFFFFAIAVLFQSSTVFAQTNDTLRRQVPEDEVLILLTNGKYSELTKKLQHLQSSYVADTSTENDLHKAFYQFYRVDGALSRPLDKWISAQPKNALAYLARGIYRTKMGWKSRGGTYSRETTDRQFSGMAGWFKAAKEDLDRSVRLDPTIVEAYCYLIEIDVNEGRRLTQAIYNQAIKIKPDSFVAREYYLWSQLPRWGGSHEAMERTMQEAKPYYKTAPQLMALEGRIDADIAEIAAYKDNYPLAIENYKRALSRGDFWFTNARYGDSLVAVKDYKGAIDQFSRVIQNKPGYKWAWEMRARSYATLGNLPEALADINYAISIEPLDDSTIASRGRILGNAGNFEAALIDFKTAQRINPSDPDHAEMVSVIRDNLSKK